MAPYLKSKSLSNRKMSSSLQQLAPVTIKLRSSLAGCIAIHRRAESILFYSPTKNGGGMFEVCRREGIDVEGSWRSQGSWEIPQNKSKSTVVSSVAIETMGVFSVILLRDDETSVLFLDSLNCSFISLSDLSSVVQPLCAGFDQNRKELLIGFTCGVLLSFAVRLHIDLTLPDSNLTGMINKNQKTVQIVCRKQIKIRQSLGLDSLEPFTPFQIATSDTVGAMYILSCEGSICCLETSTFKSLWILKRNLFKYTPISIWADHFGSDFVVLCSSCNDLKDCPLNTSYVADTNIGTSTGIKNDHEDKKQTGKDNEIQVLEYWRPPNNQETIYQGLFNRLEIPLSGKLVSLNIETIDTDFNTIIITVTNDNQIQLYQKNNKDCSIYLDASIEQRFNFDLNSYKNEESESYRQSRSSHTNFRTIQSGCTFIDRTFSLPDCPVIYLSVNQNTISTVALHLPTKSLQQNYEKCSYISAAKIETSLSPLKIKKSDKNDHKEILEKFQNKSNDYNLFLKTNQKLGRY